MAGNAVTPQHDAPRKGELQRSVIDSGKFRKNTAWIPKVSLKEGLGETYEFFSQQS